MKKSKTTKKYKTAAIIFGILHFLCLFGPFMYFFPAAFIGGAVVSKIALGLTTVVSVILAALSAIVSVKNRAGLHRGILWLLIAGVLFCLSSIKTFIWIMAAASILDELIFVPLKDHYKEKTRINTEIDKRLG